MRIRKLKKKDFFLLNGMDWAPLPKERDSIYLFLSVDHADCSFVAEEEGKFLGVILGTGSPDGKSIYVNHFLVEKDARRSGVGKKLLAHFERNARKRGVKRIWLLCFDELIAYYTEKGYRENYSFLTPEIKKYLRRVKGVRAFIKELE